MKTTKTILAALLAALVCTGCVLNAAALYSPYECSDGKIQDILRTVMDVCAEDEKICVVCSWPADELLDARPLIDDIDAFEAAVGEKEAREIPAILEALPDGLGDNRGSDDLQIHLYWSHNYTGLFDAYSIRTYATKAQIEQLAALDGISEVGYAEHDVRRSRFGDVDEELAAMLRFSDEEKISIIIWPLYDEEFDESAWQALFIRSEAEKLGKNEFEAMREARTEALKEYHVRNNRKYLDSLPEDVLAALENVFVAEYMPLIEADADAETIGRLSELGGVDMIYPGFKYTAAVDANEVHTDDGDINGDGKVNSADARTALRAAAQLEDLTRVQAYLGDMNESGKVDAADARTILRIAAKLEPNI